jgi:hypothetical protein
VGIALATFTPVLSSITLMPMFFWTFTHLPQIGYPSVIRVMVWFVRTRF